MEVARHWRLNKQRYSLIGDQDEFGGVSFPPGPNRPRFNLPQDDESDSVENELPISIPTMILTPVEI